jgi:hypothetical protein
VRGDLVEAVDVGSDAGWVGDGQAELVRGGGWAGEGDEGPGVGVTKPSWPQPDAVPAVTWLADDDGSHPNYVSSTGSVAEAVPSFGRG